MNLVIKKYTEDRSLIQPQPEDKYHRMARNALHDMFDFYDGLESEISRFQGLAEKNATEQELLKRLCLVKECYQHTMNELKSGAPDAKQHALTRFSDALLDLMKIVHRQKAEL